MKRSFLVLLMTAKNKRARPWADDKALRIEGADTPQQAVEEAHPFPPSVDVDHALVFEVVGRPTRVPVKVPRPEWSEPEAES